MAEVRAALEDVTSAAASTDWRGGAGEPSIAVLPFANLSADKENEYFGDGLAEEVINALTRIRGVKVIARTSAFAFKGKNEDIRRIAEALGVTTVLEGSVRRSGNRIRVTAQLIAAADGAHIWSERYDRELVDVFAVQDDIAVSITGALRVALSPGSTPAPRYTPALPAYEHYLKALFYAQRMTPATMPQAQQHFERAIALDPRFALAHAAYGHLYYEAAIFGLMMPREALSLVRREARLALAIDAALPEAHVILGTAAALIDYGWDEAQRHFALAMTGGAIAPHVYRYYAHYYLMPVGRGDEAIEHYELGIRADPLNLPALAEYAVCLRAVGRHADSNEALRQVIEREPLYWFSYFMLGVNHALDGDLETAMTLSEQAYGRAPWFKPIVGFRAAMLAEAGEHDRARALIQPLLTTTEYVDPIGLAMYYLLRGELDSCADWVERAIEQRQAAIGFFLNSHATALRSTSRWPALARMMNLPA
jgi:TolB-like protein